VTAPDAASATMATLSARQRTAVALRILGEAGYQDKITGHLTVRDRDDATVLVNPVDVLWVDIRAQDLLRVAPDGAILEGTRRFNPTAGFHFAIHARRHDVRVVLHNHPPFGNIWAAASRMPPLLDQSGANGGGSTVMVSEYEGTLEDVGRAERLAIAFGQADVAVLAHHGVLVVGEDLDIAQDDGQRSHDESRKDERAHPRRALLVATGNRRRIAGARLLGLVDRPRRCPARRAALSRRSAWSLLSARHRGRG